VNEASLAASSTDVIDILIDEARDKVNARESQLAILLLNRLRQTKGDVLAPRQLFRALTNLGAANLNLRNVAVAAEYFLKAGPLQPNDETGQINIVLAHHLLGQDEEAHRLASTLLVQCPYSARLLSLWIMSAPPEKSFEELEAAVAPTLRKEAQIASALSQLALKAGDTNLAIMYAQNAVADKPDWAQLHLVLAQSRFARVIFAEGRSAPLSHSDRIELLEQTNTSAERAYHLARSEKDAYIVSQARALQVDIALLDGRKEDAERLAIECLSSCPDEPSGYVATAQVAFSHGRADQGIRLLEQAYSLGKPPLTLVFMLGQSLMQRGTDLDVQRAGNILTAADFHRESLELKEPIGVLAIQALIRARRFSEAVEYLSRCGSFITSALARALEGYIALKEQDGESADRLLTESLALIVADENDAVSDFLARNLIQVGRLLDALPLLQSLFESQIPQFDPGLLLDCAARLRRDDVVLSTCQTLYDRGVRDWDLQEFEIQYLQQYDYDKAIRKAADIHSRKPRPSRCPTSVGDPVDEGQRKFTS